MLPLSLFCFFLFDAQALIYEGIVVDLYCWNMPGGIAVDGAPLRTEPERHSIPCMRDIPECWNSGFGFLENTGTPVAPSYVLKYSFDNNSNVEVRKVLKVTTTAKNFRMNATGTVNGNIMSVSSIVETGVATVSGTRSPGPTINARINFVVC